MSVQRQAIIRRLEKEVLYEYDEEGTCEKKVKAHVCYTRNHRRRADGKNTPATYPPRRAAVTLC